MRVNVRHAITSAVILAVLAAAAAVPLAGPGPIAHADPRPPSYGCVKNLRYPLTFTNSKGQSWWALIETSWCYAAGNVTTFSIPRLTHIPDSHWGEKITMTEKKRWCERYNGRPRHNCVTRIEVHWKVVGPYLGAGQEWVCVDVRGYGNGNWRQTKARGKCS